MKTILRIIALWILSHPWKAGGATFTVTSAADAGAGTLRQALADAALPANPGADTVIFTASLSGQTVTLLSALAVTDAAGVTVDGSSLTKSLTISDGTATAFRLFDIGSPGVLTLRGLTLANGGGSTTLNGGAMLIAAGATVTVDRCTFTGCSGQDGGAIHNSGLLTLTRCTLNGNSASRGGGAVYSTTDSIDGTVTSSATVTHCTFSGNTAAVRGGALRNENGLTTLIHCTVYGNTSPSGAALASYGDLHTGTVVRHCIVAGNTPSDLDFGPGTVNSFTSQGYNLAGSGGALGNFNQTGDATGHTSVTLRLTPLAGYGGAGAVHLPLPGSPALDAATSIAGFTTDQRGFPRAADGDGNGSAVPDIGAVEMRRVAVNTTADQNDTPAGAQTSLREALRDDGASDTADVIVFDPAIFTGSGPSLTLGSQLTVAGSAVVDASPLSGTLTINDGSATTYRLLQVQAGARLLLRRMTLANGGGPAFTGAGGACNVASGGALSLESCTLSGNTASSGGAISSQGMLSLSGCTFLTNTAADEGGALYSATPAIQSPASWTTVTQCTFQGNTAGTFGGAVRNYNGRTILTHCTISGNTVTSGSGGGISSYGDGQTETVMTNCIAAGNATDDVTYAGGTVNSFTSTGGNYTGTGNGTGDFHGPGDREGHTADSIRLSPPISCGGPVMTLMPLPGSPVLDAAPPVAGLSTDQRGFPRIADANGDGTADADAGAVEVRRREVTTREDEDGDTGLEVSLRELLRDDAASDITDHIGFRAQTFNYTAGPILLKNGITFSGCAAVDGASFKGTIGLDGQYKGGSMLTVQGGAFLALRGFTLQNGGNDFLASSAGAIANRGMVVLDRCTLTKNHLGFAIGTAITRGAAVESSGQMFISDCTFDANVAGGSLGAGGAVYNTGILTVNRTTFSGNYAGELGGAVFNDSSNGRAVFTGCTFTGNSSYQGSAVRNEAGSVQLIHCTVSGNEAFAADGGALSSAAGTAASNTVSRSIIAGNTKGDVVQYPAGGSSPFVSSGSNLTGTGNAVVAFHQPGDQTGLTAATLKLSPAGAYGGVAETMIPLAGSPAVDAVSGGAGTALDQRGVPRNADGNGDGTAAPDIGAVELRRVMVNTAADELDTPTGNLTSLREALRDDEATDTTDLIVFDPAVFTAAARTISLSASLYTLNVNNGVVIDALNIPDGVIIDRNHNNESRLIYVEGTAGLCLRGLTLMRGGGGNPFYPYDGGAIAAGKTLHLDRCRFIENETVASEWTGVSGLGGAIDAASMARVEMQDCVFSGNEAAGSGSTTSNGGAVYCQGSLRAVRCTFSGNHASGAAGALYCSGPSTTLIQCTFTGNTTAHGGGAVFLTGGALTLSHCTITGNTAVPNGGSGVACAPQNGATVQVSHSIIAGNTGTDVDNISTPEGNGFYSTGYNLIGTGNATAEFLKPGDMTGVTAAALRLAPLGDYGGLTPTMTLRPGSPARNAAVTSTITTDQRGFPVSGIPDCGACEAGTAMTANCAAYLWENLPATATAAQIAGDYDYDGDGKSNAAECAALTDPANPASYFRIIGITRSGANLVISFPTVTGGTYHLQRSDNLSAWVDTGTPVYGNGGTASFTVSASLVRRYFRVRAGP